MRKERIGKREGEIEDKKKKRRKKLLLGKTKEIEWKEEKMNVEIRKKERKERIDKRKGEIEDNK